MSKVEQGETMWTKLEPVPGSGTVCPVCRCGAHETLDLDRRIAVGFGSAQILRDGEVVWSEGNQEYETCPELRSVEAKVMEDPDHDWRVVFNGPLWGGTYQRHAPDHWVLVERNDGFA